MTDKATRAESLIRDFCAAWERRDLAAILGVLAPDIVYQNVPAPAMEGKDAAAAFLIPIVENTSKIDFILTAIAVAADGETVLTERIDRLYYGEKLVDIPLMGIFVVRNGLIAEWRDYTDSASAARQFAALKG